MAFSRSGGSTTSEPFARRTAAAVEAPGEDQRAAQNRGRNGRTITALPHSPLLRQSEHLHAGPSPGPAVVGAAYPTYGDPVAVSSAVKAPEHQGGGAEKM